MNARKSLRPVSLILSLLAPALVLAHDPAPPPDPDTGGPVPLYDDLGTLTYPITTRSELAQRYFDQGLRLAYAFNHAEALRAFRAAQAEDPECTMCAFGEAHVLGPNINAAMEGGAAHPAVKAIRRAEALAHHGTELEQALIAALAARYSVEAGAGRAALDLAYADAVEEVLRRFPDDTEVGVLYVDAIMNLSPWDYWEPDGITPKGRIGQAIAAAERVLAKNPDHPGAIHLYIHLTEASAAPERAEPYADRLPALMPGAGHLVHMASHTYYRIGRYEDSTTVNQAAVRADEAYLARTQAKGLYAHGYYPHNIHFVVVSAQMQGDGATALEYAERLEGKIPDEVAAAIGWIEVIKSAPFFAHAQFSEPDVVLGLADPGEKFPLVRAMWHYARGVAYAAKGEGEAARGEAAKIAELNRTGDFRGLLDWWVPAPDMLRLARHVIEGRIRLYEGDAEGAVREFETAVAIQDSFAYMEPPYWYYPVRQSLGAALLEAGRAEQAAAAFERALDDAPNNGWALYGLMRAQEALGDSAAATQTRARFEQAWSGSPQFLSLNRL